MIQMFSISTRRRRLTASWRRSRCKNQASGVQGAAPAACKHSSRRDILPARLMTSTMSAVHTAILRSQIHRSVKHLRMSRQQYLHTKVLVSSKATDRWEPFARSESTSRSRATERGQRGLGCRYDDSPHKKRTSSNPIHLSSRHRTGDGGATRIWDSRFCRVWWAEGEVIGCASVRAATKVH